MDANGLNFCQLSDARHWQLLGEPNGLEFDRVRRTLRLAQVRRELSFNDDRELAEDYLQLCPSTRDSYGNHAWLDTENNRVISRGVVAQTSIIFDPEDSSASITDIAMGYDDVLYIAVNGRIVMQDRRERWAQSSILVPDLEGFNAWRLAADPSGGVWVLDRDNRQLGRVIGMPLHKLALRVTVADHPRTCIENPNPPRLIRLAQASWPQGELPVALACNSRGEPILLSWAEDGIARIRMLDEQGLLGSAMQLSGSPSPYSIAWVSDNRVALLLAGIHAEAPVYSVDPTKNSSFPLGELYPLKKDFQPGPFVHGLQYPPHYLSLGGTHALRRLSFPFYSREGQALNDPQTTVMDGGMAGTTWHRLFIEAVIPAGCGIKVWLATSEQRDTMIATEDWFEHRFGTIFQKTTRSDIPVASWEPFASELAHQPGLLPCEREKDRSGLFSVLIQRASRRVRNLAGRFLHVQVELTGQGRETPELFALRAYSSRFSYVDQYLPQLYQEGLYAPDADMPGTATQEDFLTRLVANFEGLLTGIEDRVAQSYLLSDPMRVPSENLPWLASWLGYELNTSLPEPVQRCLLQSASELYRWHGTLRGLKLVLEIVTRGAVSSGEIIVLEDFRLRRTFASIIGADLADRDDPLTAGAAVSGNSFVGDTLFVGDENRKEFLALFAADLEVDKAEGAAIDQLFERLAHRITILVHDEIAPQNLGLIRQFTELEAPAHVEWRVLSASHPFLVGMASLVGVDSYLANRLLSSPALENASRLGRNSYIRGPGALDSRLQGYGSGTPENLSFRPVAVAADVAANFGDDFTLDGSESRAIGDRYLVNFNWEIINKGN